jgi:hypothetical protein
MINSTSSFAMTSRDDAVLLAAHNPQMPLEVFTVLDTTT